MTLADPTDVEAMQAALYALAAELDWRGPDEALATLALEALTEDVRRVGTRARWRSRTRSTRQALARAVAESDDDVGIAMDHGVTGREVSAARDRVERAVLTREVVAMAREIAAVSGSAATVGRIVKDAMRARLRAAKNRRLRNGSARGAGSKNEGPRTRFDSAAPDRGVV